MWHYVKLIPIVLGTTLLSAALRPTEWSVWQAWLFGIGQSLLSSAITFHIFDRFALNTRLDKMAESITKLERNLTTPQTSTTLRFNHSKKHHHHRGKSSTTASSYIPQSPQERRENIV